MHFKQILKESIYTWRKTTLKSNQVVNIIINTQVTPNIESIFPKLGKSKCKLFFKKQFQA